VGIPDWGRVTEVLAELWVDEQGLTTVEYAILLMLIVVSVLFSWQGLRDTTQSSATRSVESITNAAS